MVSEREKNERKLAVLSQNCHSIAVLIICAAQTDSSDEPVAVAVADAHNHNLYTTQSTHLSPDLGLSRMTSH
jgi:hypothetical protein